MYNGRMPSLSLSDRSYFAKCGKSGGLKRARRLSASQRTLIAVKAAKTRWGKKPASPQTFKSIRFDDPQLSNATFIEELLLESSLNDWKLLYHVIVNQPFGPVAQALEQVLSSTPIYGVTPLWRGILKNVQVDY